MTTNASPPQPSPLVAAQEQLTTAAEYLGLDDGV